MMVSLIERGKTALVLAPMEGVTDPPMRAFLTALGGFSYCVSEFLRVSQDVPPARIFMEHIPELARGSRTEAGTPVQVQLLGGDADRLARAAAIACELGSPGVDLNFGCPAPTVNRHDGGATLLKYPDRIREIVAAVRAAVPAHLPVSAKLRLGWDSMDSIHLNADRAAEGGASWITIHGRTKMQGYIPPAYWGPIREVQARLPVPVVANGEIWTLDDFRRCRDETRCEHYMIGRGALADPRLAHGIARELGLAAPATDPSVGWPEWMKSFAELAQPFEYKKGYVPCRMKQWARMANQRGPIAWYEAIKRLETADEILKTLQDARFRA